MNTFNKVAKIYTNGRPGYPKKIYEIINQYIPFSPDSTILEIGSGHGIATEEIYNFWRVKIKGLEPGNKLYDIAQNRLSEIKNISFQNTTFEDFVTNNKFDGIFSATAFHWIDKSIKFKKSYDLLKDDGFLICYWNNYLINGEKNSKEIQKIYDNYHPCEIDNKNIRVVQEEKINSRVLEFKETEYFNIVAHHEVTHILEYSTKRYIQLLKSFSPNANWGDKINKFYCKISEYLDSINNTIEIEVKVNIEIGKKKFVK